jgi:hypothetical protein
MILGKILHTITPALEGRMKIDLVRNDSRHQGRCYLLHLVHSLDNGVLRLSYVPCYCMLDTVCDQRCIRSQPSTSARSRQKVPTRKYDGQWTLGWQHRRALTKNFARKHGPSSLWECSSRACDCQLTCFSPSRCVCKRSHDVASQDCANSKAGYQRVAFR